MATITAVPAWTYEGKTPSKYTFFEAIKLAGLEGQRIKLDAATQRALLGFAVFGRREILVNDNGTVESIISVCFGNDWEAASYSADRIQQAADMGKQLRPGTSGGRYH